MDSELVQIIYDDCQRKETFAFAKIYFNETLTVFFENAPIAELVSSTNAEKIAVCSWKLRQKLKFYIGKHRQLTPDILNSDYEVLSFTKNSKYHQMLNAAEKWHSGFKSTFGKICECIGANVPSEVKIPIYQNHFSAKTHIYKEYVAKYLIPAMHCMTNDAELNKLIMMDSNYSTLDRSKPEKLEELKKKIGVNYYPMAPFLLERLFSVFVQNNKIPVSWL